MKLTKSTKPAWVEDAAGNAVGYFDGTRTLAIGKKPRREIDDAVAPVLAGGKLTVKLLKSARPAIAPKAGDVFKPSSIEWKPS